jgi:primosomal protein N' (replication factor Y) (superfamily II helicase)
MSRYVSVAFNVPVPRAFTYETDDELPLGVRVVAPFGRRSLTGFVVDPDAERPEHLTEVKSVARRIDEAPLFDEGYLELARWMSRMYLASLGECLAAMIPLGRQEKEPAAFGADEPAFEDHDLVLSAEQQDAVARITSSRGGSSYLYGITGSGKTEVFLQVAERVVAEGRSIIYLVPEIALTRQVVETIRRRFGEAAAVLHSRLTPSQRLREWTRIRRGEASFVIGARSAVFAPVRALGLIILDEEHESSYKSGSTPRYHARQVAMHRCSAEEARLVMGSATPSVEAWHLMNEGRLERMTLSRRLSGGAMPRMEVVSLTGAEGPLSAPLIEAVRETHRAGRQSILFLNRRGFAAFFQCRSCGFVLRCKHCSVTLTYHKAKGKMVCHYCGYTEEPPRVCPECGSLDAGFAGHGTERIEEEVQTRFRDLTVRRLDTDAARKKGVLEETLDAFRRGDIHVLLGTQMVAKGLNFPGVKLVGIIQADTGLMLPDFRASERTFSLITQVAGRAGRYSPDGTVIVQTFQPHNPAVARAVSGEIEEFYADEIEMRRGLAFPPFSRLLRIVVRSKDRAAAERGAEELAGRLVAATGGAVGAGATGAGTARVTEVMGPSECALAVISGNHRRQVLLRTYDFRAAHRALAGVLADYRGPSRVYLEVDVDPVSVL